MAYLPKSAWIAPTRGGISPETYGISGRFNAISGLSGLGQATTTPMCADPSATFSAFSGCSDGSTPTCPSGTSFNALGCSTENLLIGNPLLPVGSSATIIPGVANQYVLLGGALFALFLFMSMGASMMAYIRRGVGQMFSPGFSLPPTTCPAGQQMSFLGTCVNSAANCAAGGGVFDSTTGICNAPAGGSLYNDQLAAMAPDCPWYCVPWLTYPSTSPCSDCPGVSVTSSAAGLPIWAWVGGAGILAFLLISAVKR